jgi:quercetin dioxygenase-like cupin family protein
LPLAAHWNTLDLRKGVVAMLLPGTAHTVLPGEGRSVNLGVVSMRVLAGGGAFTLAEFSGTGEGPWTVPHLHRGFEESFFVLDGLFTFTVGEQAIEATPGMYLLVPRGTAHTISAANGGGRFLTLMVPGGLEEMFFELGRLGPDAIRDPAARAAISARYDSIPVPA